MDLSAIESGWLQWEAGRREAALNLQTKLQAKDQALQSALTQAEVACCPLFSFSLLRIPSLTVHMVEVYYLFVCMNAHPMWLF